MDLLIRRLAFTLLTVLAAAGLLLAACGGDPYDLAGAPCTHDADCPDGRCLTGNRYPGGACTYACNSDRDCPPHTACIDRDGGVCLPQCRDARDCRAGYNCDDQFNRGRSGVSYVCINDSGSNAGSVGAACSRNADCASNRCLTGGHYPGGTCTVSCDSSRDCPSDAACIDRDGGVCLPLCHSGRDCRSGYNCDDQRNRGAGGRSYVCIDD